MPKRGDFGTKVLGWLMFGARKRYFGDQSCGVVEVWCQKGVIPGLKLLAPPLASAPASGTKLLRKLSPRACSASFVPILCMLFFLDV